MNFKKGWDEDGYRVGGRVEKGRSANEGKRTVPVWLLEQQASTLGAAPVRANYVSVNRWMDAYRRKPSSGT